MTPTLSLKLRFFTFFYLPCFLYLNSQDSLISSQSKANTLLQKAQEEYGLGNYLKHKNYSDSLYNYAKVNKLTKFQILGMVNQAVYYNNIASHDTAIKLYRDALSLSDLIPEDQRTKIIAMVNLGNVYTNIGSYEKAIEIMENVLQLLDTFEDNPKIRASAYNGLANNYENLGNDEKVLEYLKKSKKLGEEIKDESIVATALSNIADTYLTQKKYQQAQQAIKEALSLSITQSPTKQRGWMLVSLGITELNQANLKMAKSYFMEAKEISEEKGLVRIEMECYKNLANIYTQEKNNLKALEAKEKYLNLKNTILSIKKNAIKIDLEKDILSKNQILEKNESLIKRLEKNKNLLLIWSVLLGTLVAISGAAFFRHRYIKRLKEGKKSQQKTRKPTKRNNSYSYQNSSLKENDVTQFVNTLQQYMIEQKPYLKSDLSHSNLADELGISSYHLSEILNKGFNQNFYNFINTYRVKEAQKLIQKNGEKNIKIIAIAFDAGFTNKTSFNRVFKNHTGMTPSEYKNSLTKT